MNDNPLTVWRKYVAAATLQEEQASQKEQGLSAQIAATRRPVGWNIFKGIKRVFNEIATLPGLENRQHEAAENKMTLSAAITDANKKVGETLIESHLTKTDPSQAESYREFRTYVDTLEAQEKKRLVTMARIRMLGKNIRDASAAADITSAIQSTGALLSSISDISNAIKGTDSGFQTSSRTQLIEAVTTESISSEMKAAQKELTDLNQFLKDNPDILNNNAAVTQTTLDHTDVSNGLGAASGITGIGPANTLNALNAINLSSSAEAGTKANAQLKKIYESIRNALNKDQPLLDHERQRLSDFRIAYLNHAKKDMGLTGNDLTILTRTYEMQKAQIEKEMDKIFAVGKKETVAIAHA